MPRRHLLRRLLLGAMPLAVGWPLGARAQDPRERVGVVTSPASERYSAALRSGAAGDLRSARSELTAVLRADPTHSSAKLRLRILDDVASGRVPASTAVRLFRAAHHAAEGRHAQAVAEADSGIALSPGYDEAYRLRGRSYVDIGEYDRAIRDYTRAIELNRTNMHAYVNRATVHARRGEPGKGLEDLDAAVKLAPADAEVYVTRGSAYAMLNRFTPALADFDKAIQLDPGLAPAYANKALLYERAGRTADAVETLKALVRHARPGYAAFVEEARKRISELGGS